MKNIFSTKPKIVLLFALLCFCTYEAFAVEIRTENQTQSIGNTFDVPVRAYDFQALVNLQFSVGWDPSVLQFVNINTPNIAAGITPSTDITYPTSASGFLQFAWISANPSVNVNLPDGQILFNIRFKVIANNPNSLVTPGCNFPPCAANQINIGVPLQFTAGLITIIPASPTCPNLVTNGDFEVPNANFTFGLPLDAGCVLNTYSLGTDFNGKCAAKPHFVDHTNADGTGKCLITLSNTANDIWSTMLTVAPNKPYTFSFWATGTDPDPTHLAMSVNGSTVNLTIVTPYISNWTQYTYNGTTPAGVTSLPIAIKQLSYGETYFYGIDDISFIQPCCTTPSPPSVSSITPTSATISWTAVSGTQSYTLEYKPNTGSTWTVVSGIASSATSYNITGLTASTPYDVRLKSICSATASSAYTTTTNFTTTAYTLSGKVKTESGIGIKNVQMTLKLTGTTVNTYTTDATGNYSFTLTPNTNYTIELVKNTNLLNGVTNADVMAIHKHFLNTLPLTSPYKIMAANVTEYDDNSSMVNMGDEIRVTQLLNGNSNPFNVSSWSFIPQSHTFTTTPPAFPKPQPVYPFVINIATTTINYDFIGIKEGDATGDADPNQ
jgi:hypothetical protein